MLKQPKQSEHCRVHPGTDWDVARQDRLAFVFVFSPLPSFFFKYAVVKKQQKEQFCLPS